jgi:anti-anti-sigma factor
LERPENSTSQIRSSADWVGAGRFTATLDGASRVVLAGELDIASVESLRTVLDQVLLEPSELILIDAAQLSFIDSVAISELLRYQVAAAAQRRRIRLVRVSRVVADVLSLLDLDPVLMAGE